MYCIQVLIEVPVGVVRGCDTSKFVTEFEADAKKVKHYGTKKTVVQGVGKCQLCLKKKIEKFGVRKKTCG